MFKNNNIDLDIEILKWKKVTDELIEKIKVSLEKQRKFEEEPSAPPYELSIADDPDGFNPEYLKSIKKCQLF